MRILMPMNWQLILSELKSAKVSDSEIARRVNALGVEVTQATVNRMRHGELANPRYELGDAILRVHRESIKAARAGNRLQG